MVSSLPTLSLSFETPRQHSTAWYTQRKEILGSKGGAVVRALASHQCGPGSNPGVDAICGLSLLLVLSLAPKGFSPGTPVFPSPQKPTLQNSNSIWNARRRRASWVNKQFTIFTFYCTYITIVPRGLFSVFRMKSFRCHIGKRQDPGARLH